MTITPTIKAKYITTAYGVIGYDRTLDVFETKDGTLFCIHGRPNRGDLNQGEWFDVDLAKIAAGEDVNYLINDIIDERKYHASLEKAEA